MNLTDLSILTKSCDAIQPFITLTRMVTNKALHMHDALFNTVRLIRLKKKSFYMITFTV